MFHLFDDLSDHSEGGSMTALTPQKAYETVRAYFGNPDNPLGWDEEARTCLYQGPTGQRCAIGVLFTEKQLKYYGNFKGSIQALLYDDAPIADTDQRAAFDSLCETFGKKNASFYILLQSVHDDYAIDNQSNPRKELVAEFDKLAAKYGLTVVKDV